MMYADKRTVLRAVWAIVLTVVLAAAIVFGGGFIAPVAYAEGAEYSNVLDDLQKDETFDISQYPADDGDYNLYVEQVAESTDGELFLYVYQPYTGTDYDLTAASVNISTGINDNLYYVNYGLMLLNSSGVFHKYLVEGFEVKADALRYYDRYHRRDHPSRTEVCGVCPLSGRVPAWLLVGNGLRQRPVVYRL